MFNNIFDSHTHSDNSFDGTHSVMFMCEAAIQKGLLGICITDHADIDFLEEHCFLQRLRQSYFEVRKAQAAYGNSFIISSGVEIGEPDADYSLSEQTLALAAFDFIIGSVHTIDNKNDFYYTDFKKTSPYTVLDKYFARMLKLVNWNKFDVLGHLTYPLRYMARDGVTDIDLSRYDDIIDEILRTIVQNGKGVEINSAGLRQTVNSLTPPLKYLKRFKELGGEIITIGSDAHCADDLGKGISEGMELALEAGFSRFAFYKARQPRMLSIY
ncbi:MAG: histidinol-phosphatase HisJ family protein [Hydrogenoanaerobacterium sp.]